ncbi:MAG: primosomal protein N' [Fimbriimonadales bacterium]
MTECYEIADVVVDVRVREGKPAYSYRVPPGLDSEVAPGTPVVVSFHGRTALGYVVGRRTCSVSELPIPLDALKPVVGVARGARLPNDLLSLIRHAADEYVGPLWLAVQTAVPRASRSRVRPFWQVVPEANRPDLRAEDEAVFCRLEERGGEELEISLVRSLGDTAREALERLRRKGIVRKGWELVEPPRPRAVITHYAVAPADAIEEFVSTCTRRPAQALAAKALIPHANDVLSVAEIKGMGLRKDVLDKLVAAGVIAPADPKAILARSAVSDRRLVGAQAHAVKEIVGALEEGRTERFLLHGVTASGKTEVYLRVISACLRLGRTAILLVPEIALTGQVVQRVRARFGDSISVLHSGMEGSQRFTQWQRIARGDTPIVVGPRSAVFAPLPGLGLIVIDEEHDSSYKQSNLLRYDGRGLAEFRARETGAVVVQGSATPALESVYAARAGQMRLVSMPERASGSALPPLEIVDLRAEGKMETAFSRRLREAVEQALSRGEQVVLFLNRRAYAPFLLCRECGYVPRCDRCSVSLSFHKRDGLLKCHHCDARATPTDRCPRCDSTRYIPYGLGTQRVEQDAMALFPSARVGRLDRDVKAQEEVLSSFRGRDLDILVGTQMVAKGLDFPGVSLVGIMNADTGLNMPDFRASERTFQLLVQVAGRAGRADVPGRVIAQTFDPDRPAIRFARTYDYEGFVEYELREREAAGYPPFRRLAQVVVSSEVRAIAIHDAAAVARAIAPLPGIEVLGPAEAIPEQVMGVYRRLILAKFAPDARPGPLLRAALRGTKFRARLAVDVDPQTLA